MEEPEKTKLAEAVLSGLLKWERRRIQEYESFEGSQEAKDALRRERRLESMFLLRRGLHVGYYQIVTRELARDARWDSQRQDLVREGIETLVTSAGTFEPKHHSKAATKSKRGSSRDQQRRYHDYFPEFFFTPSTPLLQRGRDKRFRIMSTVFSPLDVPGYVPERSPFFVMEPRYVATDSFIRTAITVPATIDFVDDVIEFRDVVNRALRDVQRNENVNTERFDQVRKWLTTHGMMSVAFRAQVSAIASVQWFRRQDPARRQELIGVPCPRDDHSLDEQAVTQGYETLGVPPTQIHDIIADGKIAAKEEDAWWAKVDAHK